MSFLDLLDLFRAVSYKNDGLGGDYVDKFWYWCRTAQTHIYTTTEESSPEK